MTVVLTAAPAAEPVSVAEAKAHLRIDTDDEDALIASLITAARLTVERTLGLALITQTWSYFLDHWPPSCRIALPIAPVASVGAITVHDVDGGQTAIDANDYAADVLSVPARVMLKGAPPSVAPRAFNAFEMAFTAGHGDAAADVPQPIRHAVTLLVAHWYERREPVVLGAAAQEVPATVAGLLLPYRRVRL
ncbi:MAG: head-tail connector protein [Methyloceanibacter sp.]|uniref:head-tail connector protein n=1 Tax=Methyloceanibacter sp. TaxID=1965321 RepID=UPI003D6C7DE7